jgi:hypothetical protein
LIFSQSLEIIKYVYNENIMNLMAITVLLQNLLVGRIILIIQRSLVQIIHGSVNSKIQKK